MKTPLVKTPENEYFYHRLMKLFVQALQPL